MNENVEQRSTKRTIITDGKNSVLTAETTETVTVDPATGARTFVNTTTQVRTKDGRVITDPAAPAFRCSTCGTEPLTQFAITFCSNCQDVTCRHCAKQGSTDGTFECPRCAKQRLWKELKQWLTTL